MCVWKQAGKIQNSGHALCPELHVSELSLDLKKKKSLTNIKLNFMHLPILCLIGFHKDKSRLGVAVMFQWCVCRSYRYLVGGVIDKWLYNNNTITMFLQFCVKWRLKRNHVLMYKHLTFDFVKLCSGCVAVLQLQCLSTASLHL